MCKKDDKEYEEWLARALKDKPVGFIKCPQKHCIEPAGHPNPCSWYYS